MGHPVEEKKYYTVEEYFQHEEESEFRSVFFEGELFPVAATTRRHNYIVQNIATNIRNIFRERGCEVTTENVKVEAVENKYYPYPDIMLTCDPNDNDNLVVKKPTLLIEVLSPGTESDDRSFKWLRYRKIPSLRYYLLVSQSEILVEMFSRNDNNSLWLFQEFTDIQDIIKFDNLDFELPLQVIYDKIQLD